MIALVISLGILHLDWGEALIVYLVIGGVHILLNIIGYLASYKIKNCCPKIIVP
jgi:hypothetical protein